ncbi:MAG: MtrB/PioB family outer membrane beta-barrel protein [Nitrospirota bacterium]
MKKIAILLLLLFGICIAEGYAQEAAQTPSSDTEDEDIAQTKYHAFPVIQPEFYVTGGYRYIDVDESSRAEEFEYLQDSIVLGGELRAISLPHRLHLDLGVRNEKDYHGDITYAYKDLILFRGINSTLFHNLDNIELKTFGTYTVLRNDIGEKYGIKVGLSDLFLRLKTPDFPAHLYFKGNFVNKDGSAQQMFYRMGSPSYRTSEKRDIDWQTSIYTVGANSHLGPVEVDLSHSEKRLDVSGDNVLIDTFDAGGGRTAGGYYHNLIPELKSSTNTLKLHTSFTGKLVASATLSKTDKENRDSRAKADYLLAAGEVTWMPLTELTFVAKYRHKETDIDNPDTVSVTNLTDLSVYSYTVRDSISSVSDSVSGMIRYRPAKGILLRADYIYEEISRNDEEQWHVIPHSTQRHKISLTGDVKIVKGVKLKAKYTHKNIDNPASNTEPDRSDEGIITLSWMPFPELSAYMSYVIKEENRESLEFVDGTSIATADNRKVKNDRLIGMVSYVLLKDLSVTASYAYMHDRVQQDIVYATYNYPSPATPPATDYFMPYKTTSHNYSFDINYNPQRVIFLNAGVSHTISRGRFYPSDPTLAQPVSIASFSELKTRETVYSASGEYKFKHGFATGIQYRYSKFDDALDNPYDDIEDGRAHIILLTFSKKW